MRFTLITERRRHAPRGRDGGDDGAPGRNLLNGEELPAKGDGELEPGDRLRIETPGGGGLAAGPRIAAYSHGRRPDGLNRRCDAYMWQLRARELAIFGHRV